MKLNLSKQEIIEEFKKGKKIRKTCGIWNEPKKSGTMVKSLEDLESFYKWAYVVDVYESSANGIDYDLIGASGGDMF